MTFLSGRMPRQLRDGEEGPDDRRCYAITLGLVKPGQADRILNLWSGPYSKGILAYGESNWVCFFKVGSTVIPERIKTPPYPYDMTLAP